MDPAAALAAFDAQVRNVVRSGSERVGPVVRCLSVQPEGWSGVEWSGLDERTADAAIAEQRTFYRGLGRRMEWKYYAYDRPADLPERLRAAGLIPDVDEALMVAEVRDVLEATREHRPPDGVRVVPVTDPAGLEPVRAVHDAVFGGDHSGMIAAIAERVRRGATVAVLALAGDEPVCAARVDLDEGGEFAGLWGGGTLPQWRGRGLYRATVALRAQLAAERGLRYLRTDALPASEPVLARLGFVRLTTTVPFTA